MRCMGSMLGARGRGLRASRLAARSFQRPAASDRHLNMPSPPSGGMWAADGEPSFPLPAPLARPLVSIAVPLPGCLFSSPAWLACSALSFSPSAFHRGWPLVRHCFCPTAQKEKKISKNLILQLTPSHSLISQSGWRSSPCLTTPCDNRRRRLLVPSFVRTLNRYPTPSLTHHHLETNSKRACLRPTICFVSLPGPSFCAGSA